MTPFVTQVLKELLARKIPISDYTFILPNKRAGAYLIHQLSQLNTKAIFAPRVLSIEDFAQEVSGISSIDNLSALFEFYTVYQENTPKEERENWEAFASWGQTLLHDFNEIDRYLIDHKKFLENLSDIQVMNHRWNITGEPTSLVRNYLEFWNKLWLYYERLADSLKERKIGYQGLVFRKAAQAIGNYVQDHPGNYVFLGFNALSPAEQQIVQYMLRNHVAEIFWDIDEVFLNDEQHDASYFLRGFKEKWQYYKEHPFQVVASDFKGAKHIQTIGVPKNIGQAKQVGEILASLNPQELRETAVVLGDEQLLIPVLNSLPPQVKEVNVTMGYPLGSAPVSQLFEQLLTLHSVRSEAWYYKEVINFLQHPMVQKITAGDSRKVAEKIRKENLVYLSLQALLEETRPSLHPLIHLAFGDWKDNPGLAVEKLRQLLFYLKDGLNPEKDQLNLEFLYQHNLLLNKLSTLLADYPHVTSVKSLMSVYRELLHVQKVSLSGKPFTGLQVMGLLESRVLDFKNVIVVSVNEGVLPAGKSTNSFIPMDLKRSYGLPSFKEKDAVYSYHFHHLLQRAENVFLLYNIEPGGLNAGEKSRFLLQLELEQQPLHAIKHSLLTPEVRGIRMELREVEKTPAIMDRIKQLAGKGFSPSALTTYIRNPLDFYKQYILGVREPEEMEETVTFNTLGTVVHDSLETFYKRWEGRELRQEDLELAIEETPEEVKRQFIASYTRDPLTQGKNLLILEVVKRYVSNMLKLDLKDLQQGNDISILQVERKLKLELQIPELEFPVFIGGLVDRVDQRKGVMRIIDYKTGKVGQNQVEVVDWEELNTDYDRYSKPFQILAYASMIMAEKTPNVPVEAGIISFKNMKNGFLKFTKRNPVGGRSNGETQISEAILEAFEEQLTRLILEICNPAIPFKEKEIPRKSW